MQDTVRAPSASKDPATPMKKRQSNGLVAGLAVIVWALVSAVSAEI
ncbi:MAG: hypothetical protein K0R85_262 [Devosia sp.]|jgi:hypothetical protein|nr:hypothetical protein [Devosia sp.]